MSLLASATERKAITHLAKCLIHFERLHHCAMTAEDAAEARSAESHIRNIIETNGYRPLYKPGTGTRVYKLKRAI